MRIKPLEELSTHELLMYLDSARKCGGGYNPYYADGYAPKESKWYTIEELKAVLSTREHVPNKEERRIIRQQRAKCRLPK